MSEIHATSFVSPKAKIANSVRIGPFCIVHDNVEIGENTVIEGYCEIGKPTQLGNGSPLIIERESLVRSYSVFYESSRFGEKLITGHHVTVRENTLAGGNCQFGSYSDIQGDCELGQYVRLQSNVFISKNSQIGSFVWLLPYALLTNDPTPPSNLLIGPVIEDFVTISARATILPGIRIGRGALIAANACVTKDVPAGKLAMGVPARVVCNTSKVKLRDGTNRSAYPWHTHFNRGYPADLQMYWDKDDKQWL